LTKKYITNSISRLHNSTIRIAKYNNTWNIKYTSIKRTIARATKNASIVRRIIAWSIACTNKFEIYKNIEFAKIYIESLIFNIRKNNSRKKNLEK